MRCTALCSKEEERDHLFFQCDHYGRLWLLIFNWLDIVTALPGDLYTHVNQFCVLRGFSKNSRTTLLLSGFPFYLLFGKIATGEFFKITLIILKLFLKGLNFKRIGGWKHTTFCSLLTIRFGDKILHVVYRLSCNVLFVLVFFWLLLATLVCK